MSRSSPESAAALSLVGIRRRFGHVTALNDATIRVRAGTVHALLGENGAGKTTLMRVAFGLVQPDAGSIELDGKQVRFASPAEALAAGLGMVHQHFTLVPAMTVAENVALGRRGLFSMTEWARRVREIGERTGLVLDPMARVSDLSVGAQQRCEIVKALARDVRVLILDEPTAVLAPAESQELLQWVEQFAADGHAVVLITHKLRDALAIAADVTVLRHGVTVLSSAISATTENALVEAMLGGASSGRSEAAGERAMSERAMSERAMSETAMSESAMDERAMDARALGVRAVGVRATSERAIKNAVASADAGAQETHHEPLTLGTSMREATAAVLSGAAHDISRRRAGLADVASRRVVMQLTSASVRDSRGVLRVDRASVQVRAGEIVGVAGVEGAGQRELLRLLSGRTAATDGTVMLPQRIGFVPEDRHNDALMLDRSLVENVALRDAGIRQGRMPWRTLAHDTQQIILDREVRAGGIDVEARTLSGGNQQKLVLGRELAEDPEALVVENPTRGLDFRAAASVLDALRTARDRGTAVVVYSSDLDEVLALADRVVVMHNGQVQEVAGDRDAVGRAMLGSAIAERSTVER